MQSHKFDGPSGKALDLFRERVQADNTLSAEIKQAVMQDLAADNKAAFAMLRAAVVDTKPA